MRRERAGLRYLIYSFGYNVTPQVLGALVLCHDLLEGATERVHVIVLEVDNCTSGKLKSILYSPVNTLVAKRNRKDKNEYKTDYKA